MILHLDYIAEPPPIEDLSNCGWESDTDQQHQCIDGADDYWGESADLKHFQQLMEEHKGIFFVNS